ncbi:hypothetical protein SpCBS45565_g04751 [Spizellomyces sp. 'palustris']|nr:hypothetical protein SpCBS45565_g04751 [Spizellomyces sp. 'palustris']
MRFQQALLLQKQQAEQEDQREEWEKKFKPVYEAANRDYEAAMVGPAYPKRSDRFEELMYHKQHWYDPIARSLERVTKQLPQHDQTSISSSPVTSGTPSISSRVKPLTTSLSSLTLSDRTRAASHDPNSPSRNSTRRGDVDKKTVDGERKARPGARASTVRGTQVQRANVVAGPRSH